MKVKVCGLKFRENILELCKVKPDMMGFIFYKKSPRYVENYLSTELMKKIPEYINKIGVFVNSTVEEIEEAITLYKLTGVQLHGDETPEFCKIFKRNYLVIKSFLVGDNFNFKILEDYKHCCDYFLFDTYNKNYGGSGEKFNWEILKSYNLEVPFFLSGGISIDDVELIKKFNHSWLFGVDINSKFEISPGLKDIEKIKSFLIKIKNI